MQKSRSIIFVLWIGLNLLLKFNGGVLFLIVDVILPTKFLLTLPLSNRIPGDVFIFIFI